MPYSSLPSQSTFLDNSSLSTVLAQTTLQQTSQTESTFSPFSTANLTSYFSSTIQSLTSTSINLTSIAFSESTSYEQQSTSIYANSTVIPTSSIGTTTSSCIVYHLILLNNYYPKK